MTLSTVTKAELNKGLSSSKINASLPSPLLLTFGKHSWVCCCLRLWHYVTHLVSLCWVFLLWYKGWRGLWCSLEGWGGECKWVRTVLQHLQRFAAASKRDWGRGRTAQGSGTYGQSRGLWRRGHVAYNHKTWCFLVFSFIKWEKESCPALFGVLRRTKKGI